MAGGSNVFVCWGFSMMFAPSLVSASPAGLLVHVYAEPPEEVLAYWTQARLDAVPDKGNVPHKSAGSDPLESDGDAWTGTGPMPPGVGRLMLLHPSGKPSGCTATVIDSPHGNVLATAFHCLTTLTDEGQIEAWSSHLMFIPSFHDGVGPHGMFPIRRMAAPAGSLSGTLDTAFLEAAPAAGGASVASIAGSQAILFDVAASAGPRVTFGYPASANGYGILPPPGPFEFGNAEYSGQRLAYCATQRPVLNGCKAFGNDRILEWGLQCVQGPGSSGGPAMVDFDFDSGLGTVVGVNNMGVIVDGRATLCSSPMNEDAQAAYQYISQRRP